MNQKKIATLFPNDVFYVSVAIFVCTNFYAIKKNTYGMTMPVIFNNVLRLVLQQMQQTFINPSKQKKRKFCRKCDRKVWMLPKTNILMAPQKCKKKEKRWAV
jgi:hypothetical protein